MDQKQKTRISSCRPPIVVVLGHVDHGKTTLLDKIRQTNIALREAGGITQHIGACQIEHRDKEGREKKITFIDTPGHVSFSKMREQGAKVADLAVLVVSAEEGVKAQTKESLKIIAEAKIPYIVALNKIDLPGVIVERAKKNLLDNGIPIEGYGGDVVVVPLSAKTGKGVEDLLEMVDLLAEMNQLNFDSHGPLEAVVIESKIDPHRGPLATVLVRNGSLEQGAEVAVGEVTGKIKSMIDDRGRPVKQALPGQPVEVAGWERIPPVGGLVVYKTEMKYREETAKLEKAPPVADEGKLKIILKTDTMGTMEAVIASLPEKCLVVESGVGAVTESDVFMAKTLMAEIIGFAVKVPAWVKKLAETEKVIIVTYSVIYELLEALKKRLEDLEKAKKMEIIGEAEIMAEFRVKNERVAGCRVKSGLIVKTNPVLIQREGKDMGITKIKSMKTGKMDIEKAESGSEFGAVFSPDLDFKTGDVIVSFRKIGEDK